MASISPEYQKFCESLTDLEIKWCFIKDYNYLIKKKYDNEIDLVAYKKDRDKLRIQANKLGWRESTHNKFNTHLIFWKFINKKPFRIDIHLDKVLATAAPKIKAKDIINTRIRKNKLYFASEEFELAVLFLSASRGREEIKEYRVKRSNELKKNRKEVKKILKIKNFDKYFEMLIKGRVFKLSSKERLGILGLIKYHHTRFLLLMNRIFHPSSIIPINFENKSTVLKKLKKSKLKIGFKNNYFSRLTHDFIFIKNSKGIKFDSREFYIKLNK